MGIEAAPMLPEVFRPTTYLGIYVWMQLTFMVGVCLFLLSVAIYTRPKFLFPILCIGYSYVVFVTTELLHVSGIVLHNLTAPSSLDHYGLPLFLFIASASLVGSIGLIRAVVELANFNRAGIPEVASGEYCAACPALAKAVDLGKFAERRKEAAAEKNKKRLANGGE